MKGIVVVPTYNEIATLEPLVTQVLGQSVELDMLIVDDNSPDGTGALADRLARDWTATQGRLHVLHRTSKDGLGRAYLAGFAWALKRAYDFVIEMDADFSHDPKFLPDIVAAADHAEVVLGSRYLRGVSVVNWPLRRLLLSWGANQYVRFVTGLCASDCTSGYRLYRREVLETLDLSRIVSGGYSFQVEMTYRARQAGFRIAEVPIVFTERREGSSKMSTGVIWESLLVPWKLRLRGPRPAPSVSLRLVETAPRVTDDAPAERERKAA